jgi:hypothetical protein
MAGISSDHDYQFGAFFMANAYVQALLNYLMHIHSYLKIVQ